MLEFLFAVLLLLALAGDARVFFFVANRMVFGSHVEERLSRKWLLWVTPPLLLVLTLLFWPLHRWLRMLADSEMADRIASDQLNRALSTTTVATIGGAWLFVAASIGLYWIVDRLRVLASGPRRVEGTRTFASEIVKLRKAHVPFATLRRLGAHNDVYDIEITRHEVTIANLPPAFEGYRIAFITDTHVASFMRRGLYREVVARAMGFEPDLVLLGGDFVSWERHIPLMVEVLLTDLRARDGVHAVLGNHDYWSNPDGVIAAMAARGVNFIINRSIVIERGEDSIALFGIDEVYRGEPDIDAAFRRVAPETPRIGISHHPDIIDLLDGRQIDLLVCGHTHGGQIRFPFFGSVVVPSKHEGRYASGFHRVGNVLMYVSRGIGAVPPLRILCKPELATFVLRRG